MRYRRMMVGMFLFLLCACGTPAAPRVESPVRMSVAEGMAQTNLAGYARADRPRTFAFPADHGPHPEYAVEWWYVTGNLRDEQGKQYGYQWTVFRTAMPRQDGANTASAWQTDAVYMAHFALTDVTQQTFTATERFQRESLGLAGAQAAPLRVWVDDWQLLSADAATARITAATADVAIDLVVDLSAPIVLQGDAGLSQKSTEPGNASYYYSIPRMQTTGGIRVGDNTRAVTGLSWLDREWSTSALSPDQVGWDWFALHLDDGSDLMLYQLRRADGTPHPASSGSLRRSDGTVVRLGVDDVRWEPQGMWRSPHTGAAYPAAWRLRIAPEALDLQVTPLVADQELPVLVRYWEGTVAVSGTRGTQPIGGNGYLEMTGYADAVVPTP